MAVTESLSIQYSRYAAASLQPWPTWTPLAPTKQTFKQARMDES